MKGAIVGSFTRWMELTRGASVSDAVILACRSRLSTGAAYTAVGDYPTHEFTDLASALAEREGRTTEGVLREFGRDAYSVLAQLHPDILDGMDDLPSLLEGIEDVIHVNVRKLYPDARPPMITAHVRPDGAIDVTYRSHRSLTALCHGLLEGAVDAFGQDSSVELVTESFDHEGTIAHFRVGGLSDE